MRTPKERFISSNSKPGWEKITDTVEFEDAINCALLHMQLQQPEPIDVARGWDMSSRLAGAKEFIKILSTLHLPDETHKPQRLKNLTMPPLK